MDIGTSGGVFGVQGEPPVAPSPSSCLVDWDRAEGPHSRGREIRSEDAVHCIRVMVSYTNDLGTAEVVMTGPVPALTLTTAESGGTG